AQTNKAQRLRNAQFLHHELQVRIAQRVVELEQLPLGLAETQPIREVLGWFSDYFDRVAESRFPTSEEDEEGFTELLEFVLQDNSAVIETMSRGVLEVRSQLAGFSLEDQRQVDRVLNRFYLARIGLRFLIQHHIESRHERPGFAGIIQSACEPVEFVRAAAAEAARLCEFHRGIAPEVVCRQRHKNRMRSGPSDKDNISFTYVPGHLQYMLLEVMKNAFKAVLDFHPDAVHPEDLPPVQVTIVEGASDVTIRVSDEGGGIDRDHLPVIWSYLHSTAEDPRIQEDLLFDGRTRPVLAGYGVGLPLSRLYARYFGGDLDIKSLQGFGTDTYLHLSRLGQNCERLPEHVLRSPAEGDSSLPRGNSQLFFFGDRKSWQENAPSRSGRQALVASGAGLLLGVSLITVRPRQADAQGGGSDKQETATEGRAPTMEAKKAAGSAAPQDAGAKKEAKTGWATTAKDGAFVRAESIFRNWVRADGSTDFPPEADRYHLLVSLACPWACRCLAVRKLKGIIDMPNLHNYLREIYQMDGIAETVNFEHIRSHYFRSHPSINPYGIVPVGPDVLSDLVLPHDRISEEQERRGRRSEAVRSRANSQRSRPARGFVERARGGRAGEQGREQGKYSRAD
ncbi:[Pyruvate dehydrogenase (acetyl-transferring)] kinase, partial [Durusdinium trenchii]